MQSTPAIIVHFLILIKPPNPNVIFRFYLFTGKKLSEGHRNWSFWICRWYCYFL